MTVDDGRTILMKENYKSRIYEINTIEDAEQPPPPPPQAWEKALGTRLRIAETWGHWGEFLILIRLKTEMLMNEKLPDQV